MSKLMDHDPLVTGEITNFDAKLKVKKKLDLRTFYDMGLTDDNMMVAEDLKRGTMPRAWKIRFVVAIAHSICMIDGMQCTMSDGIKFFGPGLPLAKISTLNTIFGFTRDEFNMLVAMRNEMIDAGFLRKSGTVMVANQTVEEARACETAASFKRYVSDYVTGLYNEYTELKKQLLLNSIRSDVDKQLRKLEEQAEIEETLLPEDEWYHDIDHEKEPDFSDCLENDGSCHVKVRYNSHKTYTSSDFKANENEKIRIVQELPNKEKLVEIKTERGIKFIVVGEDVDVLRLPKVYDLIRSELKMGRNVTTDRLSRIQKLDELLEAGFTKQEAAEYMEVPIHIVRSDYKILQEIEALNGDVL